MHDRYIRENLSPEEQEQMKAVMGMGSGDTMADREWSIAENTSIDGYMYYQALKSKALGGPDITMAAPKSIKMAAIGMKDFARKFDPA